MKRAPEMIDQELKKKIVNTISRYEAKCDKLQAQIDVLKNAANELIISPSGINFELDEQLAGFRQDIEREFEPEAVSKKIHELARLFHKAEQKRNENSRQIHDLILQCTESLNHIAHKSVVKRAAAKVQKDLAANTDNKTLLTGFTDLIAQCVSAISEELDGLKNASSIKDIVPGQVSTEVNNSLLELLNHLAIPVELNAQQENIKGILENTLISDQLSNVIDTLTELVVEAFNMEKDKFKGFLQQVTHQLLDVESYLKVSVDNRKQSANDSLQLENGLQDNILQIRNSLDNPSSVEELSAKINHNLTEMGNRIKEYRENEHLRDIEHEKEVKSLQLKLAESEQSSAEIKSILSYQKYRINHDSLTSLPNRQSYEEHAADVLERFRNTGKELCLAVCDIDRFKRINDTFGHLAGDKVLKKVASLLSSSIRSADFVARVGGEEFVLIFEQTSSKIAVSILEKLRSVIEECQFFYRDNKVDVTVSFGVTSAIEKDDLESLFSRADKAMYEAKNSGRNRVVLL